MSTPTHTPGPWKIRTGEDRDCATVYRGKITIATCDGCDIPGVRAHLVGPDEAKANARLIAASPDMVAALEALIKWEQYMGGFEGPAWQAAIDALAKAKEGGISAFRVGETVFWNDPDGGLCSCTAKIMSISGEVFTLLQPSGGIVEATPGELSAVKAEGGK